jgi:hypothetical protein
MSTVASAEKKTPRPWEKMYILNGARMPNKVQKNERGRGNVHHIIAQKLAPIKKKNMTRTGCQGNVPPTKYICIYMNAYIYERTRYAEKIHPHIGCM